MLALYHNAIMAKNSNESNSFYLSHHVISSRKARDRVDLDIGWYYYNYNAHALRWKIECLIVYIVLHIIYLFVNFKSIIFSNAIWPGKKWSHITKPVQASMSSPDKRIELNNKEAKIRPSTKCISRQYHHPCDLPPLHFFMCVPVDKRWPCRYKKKWRHESTV